MNVPTELFAYLIAIGSVSFCAEFIVIHLEWLVHHHGTRVLGVPILVPFGWMLAVLGANGIASLLVTTPVKTAMVAGAVATACDLWIEPLAISRGYWEYPATWISRPTFNRAPWWNYFGWFGLVTGLTYAIEIQVLELLP
ncbi:MAG: carotenoid biosynthesis protein [Halobacteriaceae archaeon]